MITVHTLHELAAMLPRASVVSWGNFDGVHLGHQALAARLREKAKNLDASSAAITFDPHPALFFSKGKNRHCITDTADKLSLLGRLGLGYALVLPFDENFANQSPRDFAGGILAKLHTKSVVLGHDLGFGKNRAGGFEELAELGKEFGFGVERMQAVTAQGQEMPLSSTALREAIKNGDMDTAAAMLGRAHSVHARVRHGARRGGRELGFPTANIDPGPLLLPPHGVYACLARLPEGFFQAAVNLGVNPSFGGDTPSLEAHMLDFEGDLYGRELRLYFLKFLRPERKFSSANALKEQINLDVGEARKIAAWALKAQDFSTMFPL